MNPNKEKFINTLKGGLNTYNRTIGAFGNKPLPSIAQSFISGLTNKQSQSMVSNPSATTPNPSNPKVTSGAMVDQPSKNAYIQNLKSQISSPVVQKNNAVNLNSVGKTTTNNTGLNQQTKSETQKAQEELDNFRAGLNRGLEGINQKVIPLEFQTGQKSALERSTALTGQELETRLARLQAADEAARQAKQQEFENSLALRKLSGGNGTSTQQQSLTQGSENKIAQLAQSLLSEKGKSGAIGASLQKFLPGLGMKTEEDVFKGSKAASYLTGVNQLKDMLALPNLDKLKGAMSDKDIQFLRNIGTRLSPDMSEQEFNKELQNIISIFGSVPNKGNTGTTPSGIKYTIE